jgi:hypothetical protein
MPLPPLNPFLLSTVQLAPIRSQPSYMGGCNRTANCAFTTSSSSSMPPYSPTRQIRCRSPGLCRPLTPTRATIVYLQRLSCVLGAGRLYRRQSRSLISIISNRIVLLHLCSLPVLNPSKSLRNHTLPLVLLSVISSNIFQSRARYIIS